MPNALLVHCCVIDGVFEPIADTGEEVSKLIIYRQQMLQCAMTAAN